MRPLIIITFFVLFMLAMDLYALRGIQQLFSPGRINSPVFQYIYWGLSLLMLAVLIYAGSRFQYLRDPSRFFGIMLIMGIFLMLYVPKLFFNLIQLLGDLSAFISSLIRPGTGTLKFWFLIPGAILGLFLFLERQTRLDFLCVSIGPGLRRRSRPRQVSDSPWRTARRLVADNFRASDRRRFGHCPPAESQ